MPDPAGQLHVRHPTIRLKLGQNLSVDGVKLVSGH
jgi:hypothetical protein